MFIFEKNVKIFHAELSPGSSKSNKSNVVVDVYQYNDSLNQWTVKLPRWRAVNSRGLCTEV